MNQKPSQGQIPESRFSHISSQNPLQSLAIYESFQRAQNEINEKSKYQGLQVKNPDLMLHSLHTQPLEERDARLLQEPENVKSNRRFSITENSHSPMAQASSSFLITRKINIVPSPTRSSTIFKAAHNREKES